VHESKGLEAPIVWLLDANAEKNNQDGNDVLLDWPISVESVEVCSPSGGDRAMIPAPTAGAHRVAIATHEQRPLHFSLYTDLASRGKKRAALFEQDAAQQAREEMNLLYVAMTRAQQALIVSGNSKGADKEEKKKTQSWYDRIAEAAGNQQAPFGLSLSKPTLSHPNVFPSTSSGRTEGGAIQLPPILPTGKRAARNTAQQQRGIWLHALLQHLTLDSPRPLAGEGLGERELLQQHLAIPSAEMDTLCQQARNLLTSPQLARFFDAQQYRSACNEMPYVNAQGELKRIDRLVEFDDEVWVLDYKLGDSEDAVRYRAQMLEYRSAMQSVYVGKVVRCALVFAEGKLSEIA
jgi:ATP-dependent helicase/nuclease subunit A